MKKTGGGPVTPEGKQVSSRNALVHGANSLQVVGASQRSALDAYLRELTKHYQPSSPLEKLQLERIALCKVKLDALYELERVKLLIAGEDLNRSPDLVMQRVSSGEKLTQSFALAMSKGRPPSLPMGLTPDILEKAASEINGVGGKLDQDDDMHVAMPLFSSFVDELASRLGISSYSAILRLGRAVNELLKDGNSVLTIFREMLNEIEANKRGDHLSTPQGVGNQSSFSEESVEAKKINEALAVLLRLNDAVQGAKVVAEDFTRVRDLMSRSVTLSGEESDRLMRYQTTWERRLSSAIGELLTLQDRRGP